MDFGGVEVRIIDDLRLVVVLEFLVGLFELFERWDRPQADGGVEAAGEHPAAVGVEVDGEDGLFVAFAAKHGNAGLAFVFGV